MTLGLIGRNGDLSTLCHSYWFSAEGAKNGSWPYFHSKDGVVWVCHSMVNLILYIYIYIYCIYILHIYIFVCNITVYNKTYRYLSIPNKTRFSFLILLSHIKCFLPILQNGHIVATGVSVAYMRMRQECLKWDLA